MQRIGIMSAIPQEHAALGSAFAAHESVRKIAGLEFAVGSLEDRPVVFVQSGIGKVNSALVATLLIQEFGCDGLLFSGVAGGIDPALKVGDIVIGQRLVQYDYGALANERITTYQPGVPPLPHVDQTHGYEPDRTLLKRVEAVLAKTDLPKVTAGDEPRFPAISFGTILSGDTFMNCEATRKRLFEEFSAQAIEMEGAAIAQIAERFGVDYLVVRALSDLAGADSHLDFPTFLEEAADIAATITRAILRVV
ncbi:MAG: 5'-methylthioadenosine/S-adenosylhomocysteine nucleosidase [Micavibrio sp. TMED2]|nr:MAG: 5'-methylthioadenosine/S-adenosylhomocysteine nucleosidase [Micavibrio sp. TMED2]|tara:strand:+ start:1419 stop:2171 length:753 start_codon:yes stop_codon:yes gene_type:complete